MESDAGVIMEYSQWQLTLYFIASYFVTCCMHCTQQYDRLNHSLIINMIHHQSKWFCLFLTFAIVVPKVSNPFLRYCIHYEIGFSRRSEYCWRESPGQPIWWMSRWSGTGRCGCPWCTWASTRTWPTHAGNKCQRRFHNLTRAFSLFNIVQLLLQYSLCLYLLSI